MPTTFNDLVNLMERLRAPNGCPWDREQTYATLAPMLLEEAYEAFEAVEEAREGRPAELRDELGDLLDILQPRVAADRARTELAVECGDELHPPDQQLRDDDEDVLRVAAPVVADLADAVDRDRHRVRGHLVRREDLQGGSADARQAAKRRHADSVGAPGVTKLPSNKSQVPSGVELGKLDLALETWHL